MSDSAEVVAAAKARSVALASGDADGLMAVLHREFRWTAHDGRMYDYKQYIRRNTEGTTVWHAQDLSDVRVVVVGETAVLFAEVTDDVATDGGGAERFRMPVTQVWVRQDDGWKCLAGHAGPRRS